MELRVVDNGLTCPRCGKSWVLETLVDDKVISFTCMNPDKDSCGCLFIAEDDAPSIGAGWLRVLCVRDHGRYHVRRSRYERSTPVEGHERRAH